MDFPYLQARGFIGVSRIQKWGCAHQKQRVHNHQTIKNPSNQHTLGFLSIKQPVFRNRHGDMIRISWRIKDEYIMMGFDQQEIHIKATIIGTILGYTIRTGDIWCYSNIKNEEFMGKQWGSHWVIWGSSTQINPHTVFTYSKSHWFCVQIGKNWLVLWKKK